MPSIVIFICILKMATRQVCKHVMLSVIYLLLAMNICLIFLVMINKMTNMDINLKTDEELSPSSYPHLTNRLKILYDDESNRKVYQPVFERFGFVIGDAEKDDWDLLWTRAYPFLSTKFRELKQRPSRRINHIPGVAVITNKEQLTTVRPSKYIPKTFSMPKQQEDFFKEIGKSTKRRYWIQKSKKHRGNQVKKVSELDLDSEVLIQEFIDDQFLIHGHTFQFGVYVIITSVTPLRAYVLANHVNNRMTARKFIPKNFSDIRTYVTDGPDSINLKEHPKMRSYANTGFSRNQIVNEYIRSQGHDVPDIYIQINDAIHDVLRDRRDILNGVVSKLFPNVSGSFFELTRWDFILDQNMKVYLLEVNLSPSMVTKSSLKFYPTASAFHIMLEKWIHDLKPDSKGIRTSDVNILRRLCHTDICVPCLHEECKLCSHCLSHDQTQTLKATMVEHLSRQGWRRTYPAPTKHGAIDNTNCDEPEIEQYPKTWLAEKCQWDSYWCS